MAKKKKPRSVPWGDHVLKGRPQRTTATQLTKSQLNDRMKALSDGGLSLTQEPHA